MKETIDTKLVFELISLEMISKINENTLVENIKEKPEINSQLAIESEKEEPVKKETEILMHENEKIEKQYITDEIKKLRINNALATASKIEKKEVVEKINTITIYKDMSSFNLIKESNIMVVGKNNILLITKYPSGADRINEENKKIESVFEELLGKNYKIVAIDEVCWNEILTDYKINKENYIYIEEKEEPKQKELNKLEKLLGTEIVKVKEEK